MQCFSNSKGFVEVSNIQHIVYTGANIQQYYLELLFK